MKRIILASCVLLALMGCGSSSPVSPTTDPEVIRRAEEQHKAAGKAEGIAKPRGGSGQ